MAELAVETKSLTKIYKSKVHALKGIDLKVPAGSAFGLLGPNGAGKSTLVKTLLSIVRPTSGMGWLLGRDIEDKEARREVGYLPEGHRFPRYLTGRGVCRYFGQLSGLEGPELDKQVEEKLELVGMKEWADTKITRYSKGMNQRVGLAQAMMGKPKLVILDEPTDGVDPVGRTQIRDVIKSLTKQGVTVFLNSHLLAEVEQICDEVAIMHHGSILEQGSIEEIRDEVTADADMLMVRFVTGEISKDLRKEIKALGKKYKGMSKHGGGFELGLLDTSQVDPVIDLLRQNEVSIHAIEPRRVNLEQAFIDLISQQDDQGVGGTQV